MVEELMAAEGISRSELAERLGTSKQYVTNAFAVTGQSTSYSGASLTTFETFANAMGHTLLAPRPGKLTPRKEKRDV